MTDDEETLRSLRHELRNVLSPAMMMAERLSTNADPAVQRAAKIILDSLDRAVVIVRAAPPVQS